MEYGNTSVYRIRVIIQYMYHQKHNIPQYAEYKQYKQTLGMQLRLNYLKNIRRISTFRAKQILLIFFR
jgi:hypothetical protein